MPSLQPILHHIAPFLLVLFRLSGLAVFAPMVGSNLIPARVRLLIMFMFAVALYPTLHISTQPQVNLDLLSLAPAIAAESLIGIIIGLLAAMPMYAVQLGGQVVGQQIGMGLANIYNPALDTETDVIGQLLLYIALAIFAAIGGLELTFLALASTFARVPPGAALGVAPPLDVMVGVVSSGFEIAIRVSAPVLCIILLETIATGLLSKTLPQMNLMALGFGIKIVLAMLVLIWSLSAIGETIGDDVSHTCQVMMDWAAGIRSAPP